MNENKPSPALLAYTVVADVVLVVLFALSGRNSHTESITVTGVWQTAWPFLGALAIAWLVCRAWLAPLRLWPTAVCLWLITVTGGMALRVLSGRTAEVPFVIVAFLVLALFLLGHRVIAAVSRQRIKARTR